MIQRLVDIFMAFPSLLLVISVVGVLGPGLVSVLLALGLSGIPNYTRLVRSSVLSAASQDNVLAARSVGAPNQRIMTRHILVQLLGGSPGDV